MGKTFISCQSGLVPTKHWGYQFCAKVLRGIMLMISLHLLYLDFTYISILNATYGTPKIFCVSLFQVCFFLGCSIESISSLH